MQGYEQVHAQLLSYMEEALRVCIMLESFSKERMEAFSDGRDEELIEVIEERERIINILVKLEYRIDLILDEVDEYEYGVSLPPDIDRVRRSIREILGSVTEMDIKAMQLVGGRMQQYKDETLKARNRRYLSAYIKTNLYAPSSSSYDYKN